MRKFFMLSLVAVAIGLMPALVRADNPNQEAAERISDHLTKSGQLDEKITVRYLNGTVWLKGRVHDQDHFNKAVALVFATEGVAINQVIRDELTIEGGQPNSPAISAGGNAANVANPLRGDELAAANVHRAQALPSSYSQANLQLVQTQATAPLPPIPTTGAGASAPGKLPAAEMTSGVPGPPLPMYASGTATGCPAPVRYDHPAMPGYAWPSYAAYPNYAAVTYPKQYSPTAWPYIGPFYPYPQVPLGWRKVNLQWDDGWWWLDFKDKPRCCWWR